MPLPIFTRGQDLAAETVAREALARARVTAAERAGRIAAARAERQLANATENLARLDRATAEPVKRLVRAAESGYREVRGRQRRQRHP